MTGLEFFFLAAIVGWVMAAPDETTARTRGGVSGAARAGASAAKARAQQEWAAGGPVRAQRRTDRRTRMAQTRKGRAGLWGERALIGTARAVRSGARIARAGAAAAPSGYRTGSTRAAQARTERRQRRAAAQARRAERFTRPSTWAGPRPTTTTTDPATPPATEPTTEPATGPATGPTSVPEGQETGRVGVLPTDGDRPAGDGAQAGGQEATPGGGVDWEQEVRDNPYLADPDTGLHAAGWYDSTRSPARETGAADGQELVEVPGFGSLPVETSPPRTPYEATLDADELARYRQLKAVRDAGYRAWIDQDGQPVAGSGRRLSPDEVAAVTSSGSPAPWPNEAVVSDADVRAAALRQAGWSGPIDPDGYAITDPPSEDSWVDGSRVTYPSELAESLDAVAWQATDHPRLTCCRCRAGQDDIANCACVVGEGASRQRCQCGPWDLPTALAADEAAQKDGQTPRTGRSTCPQCGDWADHVHDPDTGDRVTKAVATLRALLHPSPQNPPATVGGTTTEITTKENGMAEIGEFETTADLRAEAAELEGIAEELAEALAEFNRRKQALEEKVGAAPFGTRAISEAAAALSDSGSLEESQEALTELRMAVDASDAVADVTTSHEAKGNVEAFAEA